MVCYVLGLARFFHEPFVSDMKKKQKHVDVMTAIRLNIQQTMHQRLAHPLSSLAVSEPMRNPGHHPCTHHSS
ncbi:MAG: hypothetical protein CSA33_08530 [Desulfobulbus propionicus]|nr:MAG: hypothetical protein CSA33_08530 [Desulfobulbus propionicus]